MAKLGIITCGSRCYFVERVDYWNAAYTFVDKMTTKYYDYTYPVDPDDEQVGPQELVGWQD